MSESKETAQELRNRVWGEIPFVDIKPYSHNIIGLNLEILRKNYGQEEVEKLIRNSPLKCMGWGYIIGYQPTEEEKKFYSNRRRYEDTSEDDSDSEDED